MTCVPAHHTRAPCAIRARRARNPRAICAPGARPVVERAVLCLAPMKPTFPFPYTATVTRVAPRLASVEAPPRAPLTGGPPSEFQGDPATWSPEHLLVSALALCLFTTFEAFAAREGLTVHGWRDAATGVLDKTSSGLAFKSFTIEVQLTVAAADVERARETLERAHRHCIVSRALQVPVKIEPTILSLEARAGLEDPASRSPAPAPRLGDTP